MPFQTTCHRDTCARTSEKVAEVCVYVCMRVCWTQTQWHSVTTLINLPAPPEDDVIGTEPGWWPNGLRGPTLIISLPDL